MATRSLMALDYHENYANSLLRKHAKNRPLGDIEQKHGYTPAQPVLSCRTVNIDLQGTRTYRPKSSFDILDEQQRLIRKLYSKQRSVSADPLSQRQNSTPRSTQSNSSQLNIRVDGRPLTTTRSYKYGFKDNFSAFSSPRRPKTTGRRKTPKAATDSFMIVKVDKDIAEKCNKSRFLTNQIHSHWNSEQNLTDGVFVRGQKRPDDVPPTLDAWLTFGGSAGEDSEGVIDAFANFHNSDEYYNIEGTVGSRVAEQLQKGDKIRIGINGVLQSHDLKVKKLNQDGAESKESRTPSLESRQSSKEEKIEEIDKEENDEIEENFNYTTEPQDELEEFNFDVPIFRIESEAMELRKSMDKQEEPKEKVRKIPVPLSWTDQYSKSDVKFLNAKMRDTFFEKPAISETYPIKFDKLMNGSHRPHLSQSETNGYKVKQRGAPTLRNSVTGNPKTSKVKVMYIDPRSQEEDDRLNQMSVEEIINFKLEENGREVSNLERHNEMFSRKLPDRFSSVEEKTNTGGKTEKRRPVSTTSYFSEKSSIRIPSPKLKTQPIHSSQNYQQANLRISSAIKPSNTTERNIKSSGKITPQRPLHRTSAATGSSIASTGLQAEAEYIKIASPAKITGNKTRHVVSPTQRASFSPYKFSPGSNTPTSLSENNIEEQTEQAISRINEIFLENTKETPPQRESTPVQSVPSTVRTEATDLIETQKSTDLEGRKSVTFKDETPEELNKEETSLSTNMAAISIPTAEEFFDRDSPSGSPSKGINDGDLEQKNEI